MFFCEQRETDPLDPSPIILVEFLNSLFQSGLGYTARSAVSSLVNTINNCSNIGSDSLVTRFMKGVFTKQPALPRYQETCKLFSVVITK